MFNFFTAPPDDFDPNASNNPKPHAGKQICIIAKFYEKDTQKKGRILACDLIIAQPAPGSTYKPGDRVSQAWFLSEPDQVKRRYQEARARDFVLSALGKSKGSPYGQDAYAMVQPNQPATGIMIAIIGTPQAKNPQYLNFEFEHVPGQTPEMIANNANLVRSIVASQQSQQTALPPVPQNMQQAPHPAQMAQQYPAQQQQPAFNPYAQQPSAYPQQFAPPSPAMQQIPQQPAPQTPAGVAGIPGFTFPVR